MASTSSSSNWRYDVFPSFHGQDVRKTFLSHIMEHFHLKGINLFKDKDIERGESIALWLERAIRESRVAIVMLSRNYASSSWCLGELVEIMKCGQECRQVVIPVFYELEPSHVRKQTGEFGKVFSKTCKNQSEEVIKNWRQALTEVACIPGYHSRNWENEAALVETIATDILKILMNMTTPSSDFERLDQDEDDISITSNDSASSSDSDEPVGMEAHMEKMKEMLCFESDEVRMIGISGPRGIGKTTIAHYAYQQFAHRFHFSTIVANINASNCQNEDDARLQLRIQLLSQLSNQNDEILHLGVTQETLKDKKVLVVVDNVVGFRQLDALEKEFRCFGPGSRIIFITPDQRLLKAYGIDHIYEVDYPTPDEDLRIFCMYAFGQKSPYDGFADLAPEITTLSGKLPLGLRLIGTYLQDMSKQEWENELPSLRSTLDGEIESVLKFSYESLCDEDKESFHQQIACSSSDDSKAKVKEFSEKTFLDVRQELIISNHDPTPLKNLRLMDISSSKNPTEFPDLSTATNLKRLNLRCSSSLNVIDINCSDTLQYSFASHLSMNFGRKGIDAFVNCNGRLDKIDGASASVVVFSENCLSSTSCLDTVLRVLQCRRKNSQLVVPVFYGVSPSDVVVSEHESADRIREWSSALQELIQLPGHQSREECTDSVLVEEIVKDVYEQLFPTKNIGINSRLREIARLLCKQPWGIRRIGIWGMPGIGKTTLARAFFDQIAGDYEASCFIEQFDKTFHEKGLHPLLDEHLGNVLKELPGVCSNITRPRFPRDRLNKKKTLVVLDDVHNHVAAESFLEGFHWFGPGSLIVITSRNKKVFRLCQINHVYEVQGLNESEAEQLLSHCASGEDIREPKVRKSLKEMIDNANGNPLALSFYGKTLKGMKLLETEALKPELDTLHDIFKSSYETLDSNEKSIFLDIACFFKGEYVDYVMRLLEGCGFFPHVGVDVLVEKCLVTISENRVKMHNLIQDVGREIIKRETRPIERQRRLLDPSSIKLLLENDECNGTEDIEGIFMDTSKLTFDVKPNAFENMINLRFLKIYCPSGEKHSGLGLPKGLESLPCELRLLHWENYPLQSLPQDFDPSLLVDLNMPHSQLQKLWAGTKNLKMLKMVRLCHSQQLTQVDNIWKAQNIEQIDLEGCTKLQSFPATGQLQHLRVVNLSGCREIKSFPEVSTNIEELHLQGTGIRELLISIGNATNLKKLYLTGCASLVGLPASIENATNLKILDLGDCLGLVKLPPSIGNITNLEILNLESCSSLVNIPSSIGSATNLQELNLEYCSSLVELPSSLGNVTNLMRLYLTGCSSLVELPSSIRNATCLIWLDREDSYMPILTFYDNSASRCVEVRRAMRGNFFVLKGEQNDKHSVSLILRMVDENERVRNMHFLFYRERDTASKVSRVMVKQLKLMDLDVTFIAEMIDILLVNIIPTWKPDVTVDHLIYSQLNQNSKSHQNEAKETVFSDSSESVSHPSQQSDEEVKQFVDAIKVEEGSSHQEADEAREAISLDEEERLLEEIEAKYLKEMKDIARKREVIMERKKKLSLIKKGRAS